MMELRGADVHPALFLVRMAEISQPPDLPPSADYCVEDETAEKAHCGRIINEVIRIALGKRGTRPVSA